MNIKKAKIQLMGYFEFIDSIDFLNEKGGFDKVMAIPLVNIIPAIIVIVCIPFYWLCWLFFKRKKVIEIK